MSAASLLSDADLHGLVDGHLDVERRAEVLRRAAASPGDRARIEAWQDQNDLIRAAFAGCEREPVPSSLDLRAPPRLRCVATAEPGPAADAREPRGGRARMVVGMATLALVAAGLAGSWLLAAMPGDAKSRFADARLRGSDDEGLAVTTESVLAGSPATAPVADSSPLPTTAIPDLSPAGFALTGADVRPDQPGSVIFRYQNASAERLAIGATRAGGAEATAGDPVSVGPAYTWRSGGTAYAIAGTMPRERLRKIALSLRAEAQPQ